MSESVTDGDGTTGVKEIVCDEMPVKSEGGCATIWSEYSASPNVFSAGLTAFLRLSSVFSLSAFLVRFVLSFSALCFVHLSASRQQMPFSLSAFVQRRPSPDRNFWRVWLPAHCIVAVAPGHSHMPNGLVSTAVTGLIAFGPFCLEARPSAITSGRYCVVQSGTGIDRMM